MNSFNKNEEAVKPAYESMTCSVVEVETQGVLCASNSDSGSIYGGLGPYSGSAL